MPTTVVVSIESIAEQELGPFFVTHCNRAIFKLLGQKTQIANVSILKKKEKSFILAASVTVYFHSRPLKMLQMLAGYCRV